MNFIKHKAKEEILFRLKREHLAKKEQFLRVKRRLITKKVFELSKKQGFNEGLRLIEAELKRTSSLPISDCAKSLLNSILDKMAEKIALEFPEFIIAKLNSMIPKLPKEITLVINPNLKLQSSIPIKHNSELPIDTIEIEHVFGKLRYSITKEMRELL